MLRKKVGLVFVPPGPQLLGRNSVRTLSRLVVQDRRLIASYGFRSSSRANCSGLTKLDLDQAARLIETLSEASCDHGRDRCFYYKVAALDYDAYANGLLRVLHLAFKGIDHEPHSQYQMRIMNRAHGASFQYPAAARL